MSVLAILVYEMAVALGYYQEKIYAFHDIDHRRINMPIPQLRQNPKFFMSYDAEIV
jgi:hypothetical protein